MIRHAVVLSGQGRLHVATEQPGLWLGYCGSRISRAQAVMPMDWNLLTIGDVPVCAYCLAISDAVAHQRLLAEQAAADGDRYWLGRLGERAA